MIRIFLIMGTFSRSYMRSFHLWIQVICLIMTSLQPSDDISWKLLTKPAVFGDDIVLECKFPERICCNKFARRWLGGPKLPLLVMNGASVYPLKYTEIFSPDAYSSKLTIHTLNSTDVNVLYACTYGFVKDVKALELTEEDFESYPSEPFDVNITTSKENTLLVNISMYQVFPKPNCTASLDACDISDFMNMSAVINEIMYTVTITISYSMSLSSCPSCFYIVCRVGTKVLEIKKNVTCGHNNTVTERELNFLIISCSVLAMVALVFIASLIFIRIHKVTNKYNTDLYKFRYVCFRQAKGEIT